MDEGEGEDEDFDAFDGHSGDEDVEEGADPGADIFGS